MTGLQNVLLDPRRYATKLHQPTLWLYRKVCEIPTPLQASSFSGYCIEVACKVRNLVLAALLIIAVPLSGLVEILNFFAHVVAPLPPLDLNKQGSIVDPIQKPSDEQVGKWLAQCSTLRQQYEALFMDIQTLQNEGGENLRAELGEFKAKVSPFKNDDLLKDCLKDIGRIENVLIQLQNTDLFFKVPRMDERGNVAIPDFGNCLYEAVAEAFQLFNILDQQLPNADLLRKLVVGWESENWMKDETLRGYIEVAITNYLSDKGLEIKEAKKTRQMLLNEDYAKDAVEELQKQIDELNQKLAPFRNEETRILHYLQEAAKEGFWGTTAEFYAISQMWGIKVVVKRVNDGIEEPEQTEQFNEKAEKSITLCYVNGNHFELKMA